MPHRVSRDTIRAEYEAILKRIVEFGGMYKANFANPDPAADTSRDASRLLKLSQECSMIRARLLEIKAMVDGDAGLKQYIKDQFGDQAYDASVQAQAVFAAAGAIVTEIDSTVPKQQGYWAVVRPDDTNPLNWRVFTPAQLAPLDPLLTNLIAAAS